MNKLNDKNIVYFVSLKPTTHRTAEENLGIGYLASALTKLGLSVNIFDSWVDENLTEQYIFDQITANINSVLFVGFSCYMMNNTPTIEMAKHIKQISPSTVIVAGGYGPSFEQKMFSNGVFDILSIGEGENTIQEIAKHLLEEKTDFENIDGIIYKHPLTNEYIKTNPRKLILDLDALDFPQRPYLNQLIERKSTINVASSRGCPASCHFCSISAYLKMCDGPKWRARSIDNIVAELALLQKQGVKMVKFVDDSFIELSRDWKWCKAFYQALKQNNIKMRFRASVRSVKVNDKVLKYLKKAGFFSFSCGIENISNSALKRMNKVASTNINTRVVKLFKKYDYFVQAGYILFDINTNMEELEQNYHFLKKNIFLITKGIFSEMFAAVGTVYAEQIKNENNQTFASNLLYQIKDEKARIVYDFLKKWQFEFSSIYDKIIDPISAPKNTPHKSMKKYQKVMMKMKKIDLKFMRKLLDAVNRGNSAEQINLIYNSYLQQNKHKYEKAEKLVNSYYVKDGLVYDGNVNGFLKSNYQKN